MHLSFFTSKIVFSIGIILAISSVLSIWIVMIASQASPDNSQDNAAQTEQLTSQGSGQQTGSTTANRDSIISNNTSQQQSPNLVTDITIPQGAALQQVQEYYQPNPAPVSSDSTITWNNEDSAIHTATADDGLFDTGNINPGQSGSVTILTDAENEINYHCTLHPFMRAVLTVQAESGTIPASGSNGNESAQIGNEGSQVTPIPSEGQNNQSILDLPQSKITEAESVVIALKQAGQYMIEAGNILQRIADNSSFQNSSK